MKNALWLIWLLIRMKPLRFTVVWGFVLWLFTYLTTIDLFFVIWSNPLLSFMEKLQFQIESFTSILAGSSNIRVLSLIVFSFVTAVNLTLLFHVMRRKRNAKSATSTLGSFGAVIGSHCIACGGSFLAPLITTIAGSGAFFSAARANTAILISVVANITAIVIVGYMTMRLAQQETHYLLQSKINNRRISHAR